MMCRESPEIQQNILGGADIPLAQDKFYLHLYCSFYEDVQ